MLDGRNLNTDQIVDSLNDVQRAAVQSAPGPILVLAGAGSGKTRVLIHRIAFLMVHFQVLPEKILAVTFTNKAANEMKSRLKNLLNTDFHHLWVGTFHSIFSRILRRESAYTGFGRNFVIYDSDDQLRIIKKIMDELHYSQKDHNPRMIRGRISRLKNDMISPDVFKERIEDFFDEVLYKVYLYYIGFLKSNNGMDFDDLITMPVKMFREHPQVLEKYQTLFEHILVDEFQDTNIAQNELVVQLGAVHRNVFLVGDDDQSIYRWRGAEVKNILNFEKFFPGCQTFRLEQNYRSTKNILEAAYSVVKNNRYRKEKRLWTEKERGESLVLIEAVDENDEGGKIVNRIHHEISHNKRNFSDFVVLYRTNAQSRAIEDALRRNAISYIIIGGTKFYERKEIKDFLAYLRVIDNPQDDVSLSRILNVPARGIGSVTQAKLQKYTAGKQISLSQTLLEVDNIPEISHRLRERLKAFGKLFEKYRSLLSELNFDELARVLNDEIGFLRLYKEDGSIEAMNRYDNVMELLSAISHFCDNREDPSLSPFLEEVALLTDIDTWNDQSNAVTLMTLHSAKGLEFPVVFISGLEEGLFPLGRSKDDPEDFEEERRLFYVGLTRAKEKVYLSWSESRRRFTEGYYNQISSFVDEIDPQYLEILVPKVKRSYPSYTKPVEQVVPDHEEESQETPIYVGCQVYHETFGSGKVTGIEGQGNKMKIRVKFEEVGEKKLLYRYAQLEIL